ncbi:semaphorin-4C [Lates japonicus]|uniref:Semaphorin-4C n=1 Tax=Lates japonicus TaxID=270547 RepID=A0AAD3MFF0_LATJO|nr:semaphorin-4C [Lates japonicus]
MPMMRTASGKQVLLLLRRLTEDRSGHAWGPTASATRRHQAFPASPSTPPAVSALPNIRGSGSNGYIRLSLSTTGEGEASRLARWKRAGEA